MTRLKGVLNGLLVILLVLATLPVQAQYSPTTGFSGTRDVPLTVKVVFLGFAESDINSTWLKASINIPSIKPQTILVGSQSTGVIYQFNYQFSFADLSTVASFATFLNGIARPNSTQPGPDSFNPYFDNSTTRIGTVSNVFYDAVQVENWFSSRLNSSAVFGSSPVPGYTLFVADLHDLVPSFTFQQYQNYATKCVSGPCNETAVAHYYNKTVIDSDLDYRYNLGGQFMTGWGGNHRFYYLDLSAGPSYWTEQLPMQVAYELLQTNSRPTYGIQWRTQFVADYLFGVVYNLFAADFVYPVRYSSKYNFHLFVFDDRSSSEIAVRPLASTVDVTRVKAELEKLIPYANVTVNITQSSLSSHPGLASVIANATADVRDPSLDPTIEDAHIVDARLVYDWLSETNGQGNISQFIEIDPNSEEYDIPAFIFAFTSRYNFGFTFKEQVYHKHSPETIFGVALGDLALISHGHYDLTLGDNLEHPFPKQPGKGIGFTATIIHELGHMVGLAHPFSYDWTEDFVDSVMGYYLNSLSFSQFDRDTFLRGINDQLLLYAEATLANTSSSLFNAAQITAARTAIDRANQAYENMNYEDAVQDSFEAAINALSASQFGSGPFSLFSPGLVFGVIGLIAGVGLGFLFGYLVFKRKPATGIQYYRCPTCGQPLRWDPAISRWFCDQCQRAI